MTAEHGAGTERGELLYECRIEVRGYPSDRWNLWEQVARVETSDHRYRRRATR
ncbi:hypothetical protein ACT3SP_16765 [Brachybacterium sp. AOP43-C2-M15]|uniref:hypothetical protein n=1 Tax=Brachybacterium sp. AOP43-C2-M15 TaxID=3457661 RepID=UPI004034D1BF